MPSRLTGFIFDLTEKLDRTFDEFLDYRWSRVAPIMNAGVVSKIATIVPVAGTLLLWSNSFQRSADGIKKTLDRLHIVLEPGHFHTSQRLQFIYFGGFAVLLSWLIYRHSCSEIIKRHPDAQDYVIEQSQITDPAEYYQAYNVVQHFVGKQPTRWRDAAPTNVRRRLVEGKGRPEDDLFTAVRANNPKGEYAPLIFRAYHLSEEFRNPYWLATCVVVGGAGLLATFAPTIEVFVLVTTRLVRGLFVG